MNTLEGFAAPENPCCYASMLSSKPRNRALNLYPERWQVRANGIRNVTRSQVSVVLAHHARIGVTKSLRDDRQAHAGLNQRGSVRMPQRMHPNRRFDPCRLARRRHRPVLIVRSPWVPESILEYHIGFRTGRRPAFERGLAVVGEVDAPRLT